ncbi:MAG: alcohol dehydrogenase catalytic domain-containing protein [Vulcanimicrobiota bacterium]
MRALLKDGQGVALQTVSPPRPEEGEVVVKVMCAGLCRTDLYVADGLLSTPLPRILGHEGSGVICRLGNAVLKHKLGERVAVFPWIGCGMCASCRAEPLGYLCPERKFLGWHIDGCFAEFMVVPERCCVSLPDQVSWQAGAYLEPLTAALGVLKAPVRQARSLAVVGDNRIASLTRMVLKEFGKCELSEEEQGLDLLVETEATTDSVERAMERLKPGGVLVLKSRPARSVEWPVRLQVEKAITAVGIGYGNVQMALLLLRQHRNLFSTLWKEPVPIDAWEKDFFAERDGEESQKVFFLPQEHPCAV